MRRQKRDRTGRAEDMITFARVVEAGSLTRAAKSLGTTRSAVSKSITRLEDRLGTRLLHRTTRSLGATTAGQACYAHCARVASEVEEAERVASELRATPKGLLRVTCAVSVGMQLAPVLPKFVAKHRAVALDVEMSDQVVDLVRAGIDVGVRLGRLDDSSVVARKLASYRRVVCASPSYLARHGTPRTPVDLAKHECIARVPPQPWHFHVRKKPIAVHPKGRYRADTPEMLRQAALEGVGVTMLPSFVVNDDVAARRLEVLLDAFELEPLAIYAVYAHARHLSPNVRAFVDFLVDAARDVFGA